MRKKELLNLATYLAFPELFILLCSSKFPSGIIFLLSEKRCVTFLVAVVCW